MKRFHASEVPFEAADPRNFVGSARVKRLPLVEGLAMVYLVDFEAGGRTNWHTHSAPQLLLVTEGRGLVQKWGEPVQQIGTGDAIEPNEKHWHGAGPSSKMAHFAVNLNLRTQWLEPVSDEQYRAS